MLAPLADLGALFELSTLAQIASQPIECRLVAVLNDGPSNVHLASQDVVDRSLGPVVNDHAVLNVHLSEALVLLILTEVVLTSLDASRSFRGRGLSALSQQDRLQIFVLLGVTRLQTS